MPLFEVFPRDSTAAESELQVIPPAWADHIHTLAGQGQHVPVGPGRLLARLETRYEDSFWGTFAQFRGTEQQDYFKTDAAVTYYAPDDRWSAGLWVKNIEDEAVLAAATTGQYGPYADVFIEPPRTFGARFTFKL